MMLLSFVIVIVIVTITIVSVNGYYKNGRCKSSSVRMMSAGLWPPDQSSFSTAMMIEDSNVIKHVNSNSNSNSNSTPNSNESSETILIATLSGSLASWFISHEFTSVMIGTLLANSLAERRDSIGSTTRTFGTKIKELKNELDRILASNKKIVKTPHRFESNKAGLQDAQFWREAYSAVSYTLGNDLQAREQHLLMMKQIVEEEEKIVLKQKIEKEIVRAKKNEETKVIKKDAKKISWKPKLNFASLNLDAVFKGVSDKLGTVQQQSISTIDEWKRIELASSSSSSSSSSTDFPQQVSSMSYKQKGRMQLAAVSTTYSDYDNLIQTDEVKVEEINNIASELNIEPVITENVSESEYLLHNPNTDSIVSTLHNSNTEDEEKVETIESVNKFSIIDNVNETTPSSSDECPSEDAIVDYQQDIIKIDRFSHESDLERFRNWGKTIEWEKIKLAGSNLYYHIQKDKVSLSEEKFTSRPTTNKSIVLNPDQRSVFVRDVLQKATLKSNTYKYYRGLVDK